MNCNRSILFPGTKDMKRFSRWKSLRDHITPHLLISELRTIDADNLWMSPATNARP